MTKITDGALVEHRLTGLRGRVVKTLGDSFYLSFTTSGGKHAEDWFRKGQWRVLPDGEQDRVPNES